MQKPTEADMAKLTLDFMRKVSLTGTEVQAFVAVNNWLNDKINSPAAPEEDHRGDVARAN